MLPVSQSVSQRLFLSVCLSDIRSLNVMFQDVGWELELFIISPIGLSATQSCHDYLERLMLIYVKSEHLLFFPI